MSFRLLFRSLTVVLFLLCTVNPLRAQDDVSLPAIPFKLHWVNKPVKFSQSPASLTIVAGKETDMFRDPNVTYNTDNAPKLLFTPDSNFFFYGYPAFLYQQMGWWRDRDHRRQS